MSTLLDYCNLSRTSNITFLTHNVARVAPFSLTIKGKLSNVQALTQLFVVTF